MSFRVHPRPPADHPTDRGPIRRYLETVGVVGGHRRPHVEVGLVADDGVRLTGAFLPGPVAGAPAVVLLHGFGAQARKPSYARLADVLSGWVHVLALDLRGHGRSGGATTLGDREALDADAGVAWLRDRGHRWVGLVGASMGGTAALHAAATGADVDAVVAISAPARFRDEPESQAMRDLQAHWESTLSRAVMRMFLGIRVVPPRDWNAPPPPFELAAKIDVPLLVVHGVDDLYFPPSDAEEIADAAPHAQLWIEPEGFGHAEDGFTPSFCRRLGAAVVAAATDGGFPDRGGAQPQESA
jgi:pimeloyl-ACP methyl ester carboxylesterase